MMEKLLTVTLQWKDFRTALTKLAWDIKRKGEHEVVKGREM